MWFAYWFLVDRNGLRPRDDKMEGKLIPAIGDLEKIIFEGYFSHFSIEMILK